MTRWAWLGCLLFAAAWLPAQGEVGAPSTYSPIRDPKVLQGRTDPAYQLMVGSEAPGLRHQCIGFLVHVDLERQPEWGSFLPVFAQLLRDRSASLGLRPSPIVEEGWNWVLWSATPRLDQVDLVLQFMQQVLANRIRPTADEAAVALARARLLADERRLVLPGDRLLAQAEFRLLGPEGPARFGWAEDFRYPQDSDGGFSTLGLLHPSRVVLVSWGGAHPSAGGAWEAEINAVKNPGRCDAPPRALPAPPIRRELPSGPAVAGSRQIAGGYGALGVVVPDSVMSPDDLYSSHEYELMGRDPFSITMRLHPAEYVAVIRKRASERFRAYRGGEAAAGAPFLRYDPVRGGGVAVLFRRSPPGGLSDLAIRELEAFWTDVIQRPIEEAERQAVARQVEEEFRRVPIPGESGSAAATPSSPAVLHAVVRRTLLLRARERQLRLAMRRRFRSVVNSDSAGGLPTVTVGLDPIGLEGIPVPGRAPNRPDTGDAGDR